MLTGTSTHLRRQCQRISHSVSRRALARVLSTFLCSVFIALRPFSRFGGSFAFLVLSIKELVFSVQEDLAQQFEATVLNVTGAFFGIGGSTLAKFISSRYDEHSVHARVFPALFLVGIAFIAGFLKSRLPRLGPSQRISCFVSIWIITSNPDFGENVREDAINFVWITLCAAFSCLISSMLLLRWSSTTFATDVALAFSGLRDGLSMSLDRAFSEYRDRDDTPLRHIHEQLLKKSITLNSTYSQAAFELRLGRVGVNTIKPLIGVVEHLRRELSWGMSFSKANFANPDLAQDSILLSFRVLVLDLGHAVLVSMKAIEDVVMSCFDDAKPRHIEKRPPPEEAINAAAHQLLAARDAARNHLKWISDEFDIIQRTSKEEVEFAHEFFDHCLFVISLLQMAHELRSGLEVAQRISALHASSRNRLWLPRFSMAWLGVATRTYILDEHTGVPLEPQDPPNTDLSLAETKEGLAEQAFIPASGVKSYRLKPAPGGRAVKFSLRRPTLCVYILWTHPIMLYLRFRLSKIFRAIQHSSHLKHAMKNATGVALLSIPAFLPMESSGRRWLTTLHGQWMVISYVWVLETNTGATWRVGYLRISGTIIGAFYAYITWLICRTNPYGLVALITAADVPITWIIMHTSVGSLGTVASITLPPIAFAPYIAPDPTQSVAVMAVYRGLTIGAGILGAIFMNHFIFPRHCRIVFLTNTSRTLSLLNQLYLSLSRDMFQRGHSSLPHDKRKVLELELEIRNALHRLSILITIMNDELSLLPKPMRLYRQTVSTLHKLLDLLTGLRKIRENIPRKETVSTVFNERREFASCVCIALFACEHAFRARQPLPQFLPSARHALNTLTEHVDECIRIARDEDPHAMGLSLVYAFAETEVLKDMVDTMEQNLETTRKLFGTSAWLTQLRTPDASVHEEGPHGWYSTLKWGDD